MIYILQLLFLLCLTSNLFASENEYAIGQHPTWVQKIAYQALDEKQLNKDENVQYLHFNIQVNLEKTSKCIQVMKALLTPLAVQQDSMMEIEFDPSYESIVLHRIGLYRQNSYIDKMQTSRIEYIQAERNIEQYQYNGKKSFLIFLDDVQSGDVIEFSYTKVGQNPAFKGIYNNEWAFQMATPIHHLSYRIVASPERQLKFKNFNTALQPKHQLLPDGMQEWSWEMEEVEAYQADGSQPSWYLGVPFVQVSESATWKEVALWGSEIFKLPSEHSASLQQLVNQWKAESENHEDQILRTLRFVQKDIRYLGFELGSHSHEPTDPNLVLQRRYGDCKDKTLLLKALLALQGVESHPVLVSTWLKGHVDEWHPSYTLFDHVILQIHLADQLIWVDPTASNQEGDNLRTNFCSHYGKGLILAPHIQELSEMPSVDSTSRMIAKTEIEFSKPGEPATLRTKITYFGGEADRLRGCFQNYSHKELEKFYYDHVSERYGQIETIESLQMMDNRKKNSLSLKASYLLSELWKQNEESTHHYFLTYPKHLFDSLDFTIQPTRKSPLFLDHPTHVMEHISIIYQEGEWEEEAEKKKWENDEIAFAYEKKTEAQQLNLSYELKTLKDHVPAERIGEHRKLLENIENVIFLNITLPIENSEDLILFGNDNYLLVGLFSIFNLWIVFLLLRRKKA